MLRYGYYPRRLSRLGIRILRAVWLWAERLRGEQVAFRGAQFLAVGGLILLFWLGVGIASTRAASKATDQMMRCLQPMDARLDRLEERDAVRSRLLMTAGAMASQMWAAYDDPAWPDLQNELAWDGAHYVGVPAWPDADRQ